MPKLLLCLVAVLLPSLVAQAQGNEAREHPQTTIGTTVTGNNAEPALFNDVNLNYYDLVSANLQVSKDNDLQKVVFLPVKLLKRMNPADAKLPFLENTKVNFAQKSGLSTFGLGLGIDNSSPYSRRGTRLFEQLPNNPYPLRVGDLRARGTSESAADFEVRKADHKEQVAAYTAARAAADAKERQVFIDYYRSLLKNSLKLTVGGNLSFFEVIGGDKVDLDKDGVIDNYYNRSGQDVSLSAVYTLNERFAVSGGLRRQLNRAKPLENQKEVTYFGWSAGAAYLLVDLDRNYQETDDYYKSLFRPAIILGATAEYLNATRNEADAKGGITQALVITPFLDFKITPKNQFRVGLPIKRFRAVKDEVSLGPFLQYTLLLSKQD